MIALSVAALLAVFLLYTSIAGGGTPQLRPSELAGRDGRVSLVGRVVGRVHGRERARTEGMRFTLRDVQGSETVRVLYKGSVPDLFTSGRDIVVDGRLRNGVFIAEADTLVTKCPSKYAPERGA